MIDVHCHLQFHSFENDFDAVAQRAFAAGVTRIINVGTSIDSSQKAVEFAEKYEQMYAVVGVHPHHADKVHPHSDPLPSRERGNEQWIIQLEELAKHPKTLAIGEVGMDYFSYKSNDIVDPGLQKKIFEQQIELSYKVGLPLQIHNRQAGKDVLEILQFHKDSLQRIPGMFHCFAGDMDTLKTALQMGFFIGFDGNVTYNGLAPGETTSLQDIAKYTPLDRMVVETDAPFLTPIPHRGERNEPEYVIITGQFLAKIKGIAFDDLVEHTTRNVYTIFSKLRIH